MKEVIHIQNVGPLSDVLIENIRPLTVLIGESASGKSTLMKVIDLMRYIYKMVNIRSYLKNANITKSPFRFRFQNILQDDLINDINDKSIIEYVVLINNHKYSILYKNGRLTINADIPNEDLVFIKESFVAETRSIIPSWVMQKSSDARLGYYFNETFEDFNSAINSSGTQSLGMFGLEMVVKKTSEKGKRIIVKPTDGSYAPLELRYASSGIQTTAPLMAIVRYFAKDFSFKDAFRRSVLDYLFTQDRMSQYRPEIEFSEMPHYVNIHVEEPELSTYPTMQCQLINELVKIIFHVHGDDRHLTLIMATHSPYIVNYLNLLLQASYSENGKATYPYLNPKDVDVYKITNGRIESLMSTDNETSRVVIDTLDLSEPMEQIYDEFSNLE